MTKADANLTVVEGWVLYDGTCGFCRKWVPYWKSTLNRHGFQIAPLQSTWVAEKINLPPDQLLSDIRVLLPDGSHRSGADAYRYVLRRLGWTMPLYVLAATPPFRQLFDRIYRFVARNRYRLWGTCELPSPKDPSATSRSPASKQPS